ncbi:MAG: YraN family protein [Candidatus Paceibacterota bacterium]
MTKTPKRRTGDIGENVACRFLESKKFKILERNYLKKWGEIDIVSEKKNQIHFIEVKTISRNLNVLEKDNEYRAEENVHPWKLKRLNRAIESYLEEKNISDDVEWTLDLIVVYLDLEGKKAKVEYLENIF